MDEDRIPILGADPEGSYRRPAPGRGPMLVAVGAFVGALVVFGLSNSGTTGNDAGPPSTTLGTTTTVADPVTSATNATTTSVPTTLGEPVTLTDVNVELLSGAEGLLGEVVVVPFPGGAGSGTLWVLRPGGSVVRRDDVPFDPGGRQYPILMTGGWIAFGGGDNDYLVDVDLVEGPEPMTEPSFVIAGSAPGLIWLVGTGVDWVAPLDVESQTVGERIDVAGVFSWPLAGIADGLIVTPVDEETYGRSAYWSPGEGLQPIQLPNRDQSGVHAASGNIAVVVSPGELSILDIASGEYLSASRLELGDGNVSEVCLSPDQRFVAVVGSTGEAYIVEVDTGTITHRLFSIRSHKSIGWSDPSQFVYIADTPDGTTVQTLDIDTGQVAPVAQLTGNPTFWSLTASATMC